jgi:hypothetical protein
MLRPAGLTLFVGKSFTGKTARLLHEIAREPRVVLVDGKCAGLAELSGFDHLWPEYLPEHDAWRDACVPDYFRVAGERFRVCVHFRSSWAENLNLLCYLLQRVRRLVLAIDELSLFIPVGSHSALPESVAAVLVSGTHDGIRVLGTVQRPSMVHVTARANCGHWFIFRVTEQNDLDAVRPYVSDGLHARIAELPDFVYVDAREGLAAFVDYSHRGKLGDLLPARIS